MLYSFNTKAPIPRLSPVPLQRRTIVREAVNTVIDKAPVIVCEDLTSQISGKKFSKNVSRRLSGWTKGVIAQTIENVSRHRGSAVVLVNVAIPHK